MVNKQFLYNELPIYLVYLVSIVLVSKLAYDQGFYGGMKEFCNKTIMIDEDNNFICDNPPNESIIPLKYDYSINEVST